MFRVGDRIICTGWDDIPRYKDHKNKHVLEDRGYDEKKVYTVTGTYNEPENNKTICKPDEIIIDNVIIINIKYFKALEDIRDEKISNILDDSDKNKDS